MVSDNVKLAEQIAIEELCKIDLDRNFDADLAHAIDTAIDSLEGDIPKKVDRDVRCPACLSKITPDMDYCIRCGQALDWD